MMLGFTLLLSVMSYDTLKMPGFGSGVLLILSSTFYVLSSYLTHKLIGYLEIQRNNLQISIIRTLQPILGFFLDLGLGLSKASW
jgi:hypothetical protein